MSLKLEVEKIFKENANYSIPGHAVNQASSINALSSDLYTDSKRFIYELLQNADDSYLDDHDVKVWIKIFGEKLVVAHSGKPFNSRDLRGICNIANGTKKSDITKTGYKGIGFKSVFGQSDKVTIFSKKEYFRFDSSYPFKWIWDDSKVNWENANDREFQFPWQIIPIHTDVNEIDESINKFLEDNQVNVATIIQMKNVNETRKAVQELSQNLNMFLFLKKISEINFDVMDSVTIKINRTEKDKITLKNGRDLKFVWLINTISLTVPTALKKELQSERNIPEKLLGTDIIELTLAAKVGSDGITRLSEQETMLYSYLPTDERNYSLPILINTSFLTTSNRESLHSDSKWNQWLFKTIAIEIFHWISTLVTTEYSFQAYRLIPKDIRKDDLGNKFNEGIKEALRDIPFIITREGNLAKIEDTIVDFTHLSEKTFVGEEPIEKFIEKQTGRSKQFVSNALFFREFKNLGFSFFEWKQLKDLLTSKCFTSTHTIANNVELIKYFKKICETGEVKEISHEALMKVPFIWDHKNHINYPNKVCFPTADDQNWDNPNSELSFLHKDLQIWLHNDSEIRHWLETLGVKEKTDITYVTQIILPKIESFITSENALQTIRDLFSLYKKGDLIEDLIGQLSRIKLITQKGSLCSAKDCFLSDYYKPRLEIEKLVENDFFVSEKYCVDALEKDEWKRFFRMLGVCEGIKTLTYSEKNSKHELGCKGIKGEYFDYIVEKTRLPYQGFSINALGRIITLKYIQYIENNIEFAFKFWSDCLETITPDEISASAKAYWGYSGMDGQTNGYTVENYVPWFIMNIKCIPTVSEKCEITSSVLLNTPEIKDIAGKYLPVFNGPELVADWKAFFNFRTSLDLQDYLDLLSKISVDVDKKGNIKNDNSKRIQSIYSALLVQCVNWSSEEIEKVEVWATTGHLLNTKNQFTKCNSLKYFLDGNEAIFQEQYCFIKLSAEYKNNPNLERFLTCFKVQLLRQSEFELIHTQEELCSPLMNKLKSVAPYFKIWITSENGEDSIRDNLENLESKIEVLMVLQAEELKISYSGIDFIKNVNIHFNETSLYVTDPWNSNSVLLKLSDVLCRYFQLAGHEKKLDFLLRSTDVEIQKYFLQEEIYIPEEILEIRFKLDTDVDKTNVNSFADIETAINNKKISAEFYHMSKHDYGRREYIQERIPRAVTNVIQHLKQLPEYDCSNIDGIAKSVISGITKNGNEITVVARPSDDDKVLIYYASEFDVLEYVDAELWCEDGITPPKQITLGQLLKITGINRIPIKNIDVKDTELQSLLIKPKSEALDFNAIPYGAQKIAKIISSFANTSGGTLIFGLKEISPASNKIVGLSSDFHIDNTTKKAISMLVPIPTVTHGWVNGGEKSIYIIKTEKSDKDILLENQKYIRGETNSVLDKNISEVNTKLNITSYRKTIAIIIAIENYATREENQVQKVKYASNDALKFKEMLINSMCVDENDIHMYVDDDALKSSLEYNFMGLFHSLAEDDRLVFYYVGHGFHNGTTNFLSTFDMHPLHIAETSVSLRKILIDPLLKSKCKNVLIFIDACAQSFKEENVRRHIKDIDDEEILMLTNDFPYYATFLSCQPGQSSYSSDVLNNGIWTHHLVKAINGDEPAVIYDNKYITDISLMEYLSSSVADYTKQELGFDQNPKAILDSSFENVITKIRKENV
ncbi:putative transcriptional regulator [Alkaliphilus metalliredigens QYMF]|uniref:Putative transcriptional regulator n=1 Tax=Alkaliphilus metalliredigens (strain QYMF) TaxID=293826 RepID=A6TNL9_ALKMQ|nr:RNA-binding domain-containing protein [Alkaliphilus metalliredigens]ABR47787.1 putative transcriptional regulator [Alkaliphilus metalliredigens QYMF]